MTVIRRLMRRRKNSCVQVRVRRRESEMAETIPPTDAVRPERRRGLRFPFEAQAEVSLEGSEQKVPARVTEIGPQGCFLQMGKPFDAGSAIFVRFFAEAKFFETKANVAYSKPNSGLGVS